MMPTPMRRAMAWADLTGSDENNDALYSVTRLIGDRCQVLSHSLRFVLQRRIRYVDALASNRAGRRHC